MPRNARRYGSKRLPMARRSIKEMNQLIARIRAGDPPKVPDGRSEERYLDPALLRCGFGIRVLRTGGSAWYVHYKRRGIGQRTVTLGKVLMLDRDAAIEQARELLGKIDYKKGWDPRAAREEAAQAAKVTFESLIERFLKYKKDKKKRADVTVAGYRRYLTGEKYFKLFHKRPLSGITRREWSDRLDHIAAHTRKQSGIKVIGLKTYRGCYALIKDFINFAIKEELVPKEYTNPLNTIDLPEEGASRERSLSNYEIRLIWKTCEAWEADVLADIKLDRPRGSHPSITDLPRAVQLLFLTGCRTIEIGKLLWDSELFLDLEPAEINLPPEKTKNGQRLIIPLAPMALDILRRVERRPGNPYVFGNSHKGQKLANANKKIDLRIRRGTERRRALIDPIKEQHVRDLLTASASNIRVQREAHVNKHTIKIIKARMAEGIPLGAQAAPSGHPPLQPWTLHDIRRTFVTRMAQLGVPDKIAERLVGHKSKGEDPNVNAKLRETYDQHEYWDQKCDAIDEWQKLLRSIIDGTAQEVRTSKSGRKTAELETTL
jgi:site-specific recombinase XerD